jgi:argininosuccinate synthase
VKNLKKEFAEDYIWPSIQMGLIYEGRYLLGTSLARPCITVGLIESAKEKGCAYISHGATGKGNDQVRFELCSYALYPEVKVRSLFFSLIP